MTRDRAISAVFAVGWKLVCRLPESWARLAFTLGADIAWIRRGHKVRVLEGNLRRIVGPEAARAQSRRVMRSYMRYYMEAFRLHVIPKERLLGSGMHLECPENMSQIFELLDSGRGVIVALPHMGNFEQGGAWIIANGAGGFTTVAERLEPESVYEQWLAFRQSLGFEVIPTTGGPHPYGVMAQRLRAGKLVCIVADRDLSDTGVEVDFFGEKALMAAGSAALAVRTGAALMPASCWFVGKREWAVHVHDEIPVPEDGTAREKIAVMTQQLATAFEQAIRQHPDDWHMLQRVFEADLDPARRPPKARAARRDGGGETCEKDAKDAGNETVEAGRRAAD